ncbi:MAG: Na/Pi symporter [Candidatus Sumerlaeaceae bacterium]|nr:Na/Pi symporter [Candidatus Sumerlaeaceae bacterium]
MQTKFGKVGTTETLTFFVRDENGIPLSGVELTPVVVPSSEGARTPLTITPKKAVTDLAGFVTFEAFMGDQVGRYSIIVLQKSKTGDQIAFTRFEIVVQDDNWATLLFLTLLGGLAVFLYGLNIASQGLRTLVGDRLKQSLEEWTQNPFSGMVVGFLLTTLTQSSGATTALVMTLVRTGAISFSNSVGIILGAAISGTITVQLISLNLFAYALPAVACGMFFYLHKRNKKFQGIGMAIVGFGFVFYGLKVMTDTMTPLKAYPLFMSAVKGLSEHPVWAMIFSFLFTAVAQSSGATVGIVISLTRQELLTLEQAIPMFFGAAIGASVTGLAAAVGATAEAKRVALAHLVYKLAGTLLFLPVIGPLAIAGLWLTERLMFNASAAPQSEIMARAVANTYTLFMVVTAFLTVPAIPWLEKLCRWLVPDGKAKLAAAKYLVLGATDYPEVLLGSARREISRMARFVEEMFNKVGDALFRGDESAIPFVRERDTKVDGLNIELTKHLINILRRDLDENLFIDVTSLMFVVSDLEAIGDIIDKNLVPLARKMLRPDASHFSEEGRLELESLHMAVGEQLSHAVIAITAKERSVAERVVQAFGELQNQGKKLHCYHLARLRHNVQESFETSSVHLDVINYLLRIDYLVFEICLHLLGRALPDDVRHELRAVLQAQGTTPR